MAIIAIMLRIGSLPVQSLPLPHCPFPLANPFLKTQALWLFVAFTFIFFDVFSLGILPISWLYASEIMPQRTRNKGVALGVGLHWLSNFVIVYITPTAIVNLGFKLYIIWAVLNALVVPVTWFFYPETAGRSLEDVDAVFKREKFGVTRVRNRGMRRAEGVETGNVEEVRGRVETMLEQSLGKSDKGVMSEVMEIKNSGEI